MASALTYRVSGRQKDDGVKDREDHPSIAQFLEDRNNRNERHECNEQIKKSVRALVQHMPTV